MKSFVVVGLGYGDEGKGATVDFLCSQFDIDFVVKYSGGHQAGHRVVVGEREHVFSQFGAGALAGVPTILDRDFIIEPMAMRKEREALEALGANTEIFIHPECPVTTRYHRAYNRLMESSLRHGSCGVGVGATRWTDNLGIGLRAGDLPYSPLKLESTVRRIRAFLLSEATRNGLPMNGYTDEFLTEFDAHPRAVVEEVYDVPARFLGAEKHGMVESANIVFEGSQGVLLDETYGQHPNTTWSTVTPRNAFEFPGFSRDQATVVGVMRTYMTRHGNGEFHSDELSIGECDPNNPWNEWQGSLRSGKWNFCTLRDSCDIANVDVLSVNHLDVIDLPLSALPRPVLVQSYGPDRSNRLLAGKGWKDIVARKWIRKSRVEQLV